MNRVIWKFPISHLNQRATMPIGAQILSVDVQHGEICVWALVDPTAGVEQRKFCMVGTGHAVPDGAMNFLGTALLMNGALVIHLFEELSTETFGN